jgi:hypothetical protein
VDELGGLLCFLLGQSGPYIVMGFRQCKSNVLTTSTVIFLILTIEGLLPLSSRIVSS